MLLSPLGVVGLLGGMLPDLVLRGDLVLREDLVLRGDLVLREATERLPAPPDPYTLPMILVAWADI